MPRTIAVTGGPGGGKSTVAARLGERFGVRVVVVPEVATHLLGGFFPPIANDDDRRSVQRAIYRLQLSLEEVHRARAGDDQTLICDRGLVDGAAYWPDGSSAFFESFGVSPAEARQRYDAVVFLESAAVGGLAIVGNNRARLERLEEAVQLDERLRSLWEPHPRFHHVPHARNFSDKLESALETLESLLPVGTAG